MNEEGLSAAEELGEGGEADKPVLPSAGDRATADQYNAELEYEVHSYLSLGSSRGHCLKLLSQLPPYNKTEMAVLCVKQELQLQESIRDRSFSDGSNQARIRRFLAILVGFGTFTLAIFAFAWVFFHPKAEDEKMAGLLLDYSKWAMGGSLGTVLIFYFPKIKFPKRSKTPESQP